MPCRESAYTESTPRCSVDSAQVDPLVATVLTVSDRSAQGLREDHSGARAQKLLEAEGWRVSRALAADDLQEISTCLKVALRAAPHLIVTTGGTGVSRRDVTPEATQPFLDRDLPGVAEGIRAAGVDKVPASMLSRGLAGMHEATLIVNLAGSVGAVEDGLPVVLSVAQHATEQAQGKDHA